MCTHDEMADYLGISKRTFYAPHLRERFERVTRMAAAATRWDVRKKQHEQALKGQPVPSIWWGKQHLNQSDRNQLAGPGGGPLEFATSASDHLSEVLDRLASRMKAKE